MDNSEKIVKLEAALRSSYTPEALKGKIREQIANLKNSPEENTPQATAPATPPVNHPLSEKDFYKRYTGVHKDFRSETPEEKEATAKSIMQSGFRKGLGNVKSLYKGAEKENELGSKWLRYKQGDYIYILPDKAWKVGGRGGFTIEGHKPTKEEVLIISRDLQTPYEAYLEQFEKKEQTHDLNNTDKDYIPNRDLKSITVLEDGKQVTYSAKDALNGANFNTKKEKGGKVADRANYYKVDNVVHVTTTAGERLKPDNGYWIKKTAKPILESGGEISENLANWYNKGDLVQFASDTSDGPIQVISEVNEWSDKPNTYDLTEQDTETQRNNISGKKIRPAQASDKQKKSVSKLDMEPGDSAVINENKYDSNNYTYSFENTSTDTVEEGFRSEYEAYEELIRFLQIRKELIYFYYLVGYEDQPVAPNSLIEKDYGREITKVQKLIYKGDIDTAFAIVARGESDLEDDSKKMFYKMLKPLSKKQSGLKKQKKSDGRSGNGNAIFTKAKEIRKPGEPWQEAVSRARKLI